MKNLGAFIVVLLLTHLAQGAQYYILDTIGQNVTQDDMRATTNLVRNSVNGMLNDNVVDEERFADFSLQPRLMKLGETYILTVEKLHGDHVLFAGQARANAVEELDRAATRATAIAVNELKNEGYLDRPSAVARQAQPPLPPTAPLYTTPQPPPAQQYYGQAGTIQQGMTSEAPPANPPAIENNVNNANINAGASTTNYPVLQNFQPGKNYWAIGFGPFISRRLATDNVMYDISVGHFWDVTPNTSVKVVGEGNFASGSQRATFLDLATGLNYYFYNSPAGSPYATADLGYGWAESVNKNTAAGFSFGVGLGYQFFRQAQTSMDLQVRYAIITDTAEANSYPSVLGTRLSVNF